MGIEVQKMRNTEQNNGFDFIKTFNFIGIKITFECAMVVEDISIQIEAFYVNYFDLFPSNIQHSGSET